MLYLYPTSCTWGRLFVSTYKTNYFYPTGDTILDLGKIPLSIILPLFPVMKFLPLQKYSPGKQDWPILSRSVSSQKVTLHPLPCINPLWEHIDRFYL